MDASFSHRTRAANLEAMAAEPVDLLVIGAGITGAGAARDASMRGIRTALVDKADFASGTSSRSSRLIHGGLRYLEHGELHLVFEASRERRVLLKIAPHLVWPRSFLFPVYRGQRVQRLRLAAGLWLYDLLATLRNVGRHRMLSKRQLLRDEPSLRRTGLKGGARYWDAQCDDARLALANVKAAHLNGALVANYTAVERFERAGGRVQGAVLRDRLTGRDFRIEARVVVTATGPWSDAVRSEIDGGDLLRPTKGTHVMVPRSRLGNHEAITLTSPIDGRVMFILPWNEDLSYIGTTDTDCEENPDDLYATAEDVIYLLRSANSVFPTARLQPEDVVATWAGLRPLLRPPDPRDPASVSREHRIVEGESGVISIIGGKLTTYRLMAEQLVDTVAKHLNRIDGRPVPPNPRTDRVPLPGGESHDLSVIISELESGGLATRTATHLARAHGSEAPAIARLQEQNRELREPITRGHPAILAELVHAARREMAVALSDFLIRRTHVFYETRDQGAGCVESAARVVAGELGWTDSETEREIERYLQEVECSRRFQEGLGTGDEGG